jgi:hypothetical protein
VAGAIVLIGGSASVGKTWLATELAPLLQCRKVVHLDDVRDGQGRAGPFDAPTVWDSTGEQLLGLLLEETRTLHRPLVEIIARTRNERMSVLIEGEGVEPEVVDGFRNEADVRSVFIVETGFTSTCSPWVPGRESRASSVASTRAREKGRPARCHRSSRYLAHHAASSESGVNGGPAGFHSRGSSPMNTDRAESGSPRRLGRRLSHSSPSCEC